MATSREKAIAALRKNAATKDAFEAADPVRSISSGSFAVDVLTGIGGFPLGRISEVFGWEYSGKTTLCVSACAAAQRAGLKPVYIDAENGLDTAYAAKLGFDVSDDDRGLYARPTTFEQTLQIVEAMAETGESPLIVVDSIPAMVPEAEMAELDKTQIGARARLLATSLPKLKELIRVHNTALVFINQMRQKLVLGAVPSYMIRKEDTEQSSGGSALKFFSSLRIDMRIVKRGDTKASVTDLYTGKQIDIPTGNIHEAKTIKNRHGIPYQRATFAIRYDEQASPPLYGIDNIATLAGVGIAVGVVEKQGGGVYRFDALEVKGEEAFLARLRETPDLVASLEQQVSTVPAIAAALARRA